MFAKIVNFFGETRQEWRHINWPTRSEAMYLTAVVIGLAIAIALFLGAFDYLFITLLKSFIAARVQG